MNALQLCACDHNANAALLKCVGAQSFSSQECFLVKKENKAYWLNMYSILQHTLGLQTLKICPFNIKMTHSEHMLPSCGQSRVLHLPAENPEIRILPFIFIVSSEIVTYYYFITHFKNQGNICTT